MSATTPDRRVTVSDIARMHADGQRLAVLTAYDYPTARILDEAGIPMILVGDSLGEVLLGYESTVRVTLDEMLHHTKAVVRGASHALVIGDMPFLTYATPEEALVSAGRFMREAGTGAVKVEGGVRSARVIETLVRAGIPVMGHIGWTPQAKYGMGGKTRVQGKDRDRARAMLADALAVQEAGAFSTVLELMPEELAAAITQRLRIPTIGIGAGAGCSGQVQVITDLLGLGSFIPRHARPYAHLRETIAEAAHSYAADVAAGTFPGSEQTTHMDAAVLAETLGTGALDRASTEVGAGAAIPLDEDLSRVASRGAGPVAGRDAGPVAGRDAGPVAGRVQRTRVGRPRILRTRAELRAALAEASRPVGLVPTMGWLHAGHRSLMQRARRDDATSVVTIFVNPRQFGDPGDLARYPRDEPRDLAICAEEGVDLVWAPPVEEVYVPGFDTTVTVGAIAGPLEGAARPGHFDGVATVVAVLFGLVGAEHAYFGQKDAQQVEVIRRMSLDLALPTEVITCPTVREADGLALSSRNVHLSVAQRAAAPVLRRALLAARARWEGGERTGDVLRAELWRVLAAEPLAAVDYVSAADAGTLAELDRVDGPALLSLAVSFGSTRLIDNEPLP